MTTSAALLGFLYCSVTSPLYTADTIIELRGHAPVLSTIQSETLFGSDTRRIEYQKTTVAKITLEGLADEVLGDADVAADLDRYWRTRRGFASRISKYLGSLTPSISNATNSPTMAPADSHFTHPRRRIQKYLSLIDIEPVHETNLVHIRATTANRALSQRIANAHATHFIEHLKRERQDSIQANVQLLQSQATGLKARVTQAENELNTFATQNKLLLVRNNESISLNNSHIQSLTQMLADATGRRVKAESALTHARKSREADGSFLDTEIVNNLRASLKTAETEYATLGSQVTAAYPSMRELHAKIVSLKKAIQDERAQGIHTLQRQYEADLETETQLREQINQEKARAQDVSRQLIQYDVLSKEASSLRDLYQAVLKQAKEIEMSAAVATSNVFVVDYAGIPAYPSAPKTKIIVLILGFVGFASSILTAYILESLSNTIESTEDLERCLNLPVIGSVPSFTNLPSPASSKFLAPPSQPLSPDPSTSPEPPSEPSQTSNIVTVSAPHSIISEALRTIRANVLLSSADYPPRVILLTSSIQSEGKTTIMANLAVTLAQANHRTLMIDGDLRMAGLSSLFLGNMPMERPGLTDLLARHLPLEQTIHTTSVPGLDILPCGTRAPNPAELVGSESMKRLLTSLKDRYDFILVDSPPVMAVADSLLLSRMVDSVLFVVRNGATPRNVAHDARQKLSQVKARIIGVVLNDVSPSSHSQDAMLYGAHYLEGGSANL
jgi:capsular exopolysaccharide synthesis family protein